MKFLLIDWEWFMARVNDLLSNQELMWNPMKKKPIPWIDLKKLNKVHGDRGCVII